MRGLIPIANAAMRLGALAGRFGLSIFLVRYYDLSVVGSYGLIQGMSALIPPCIGLGLNYYLNRETIGAAPDFAGPLLRDRLLVTTIGLIIVVMLGAAGAILFSAQSIPVILLVSAIVIFETYFFDIQLTLFSLKMPIFANFLLLVRTSSWCVPFVIIMFCFPGLRTLTNLLFFWVAGELLCGLVLFWHLRHWPWGLIAQTPVDFSWLKSRIVAAKLIYLGDIGLAGYGYLDRFLVAAYAGLKVTGGYVFLQSLSTGLQTLVTSSVIQVSLPYLVESYRRHGEAVWLKTLKRLVLKTFLLSSCGGAAVFVGAIEILPSIHKAELLKLLPLFAAMLVGSIVKLVSDIVNYGLYSRSQDISLAVINVLGLFVTAVATVSALYLGGLYALRYSVVATPVIILLFRWYSLQRPAVGRI